MLLETVLRTNSKNAIEDVFEGARKENAVYDAIDDAIEDTSEDVTVDAIEGRH